MSLVPSSPAARPGSQTAIRACLRAAHCTLCGPRARRGGVSGPEQAAQAKKRMINPSLVTCALHSESRRRFRRKGERTESWLCGLARLSVWHLKTEFLGGGLPDCQAPQIDGELACGGHDEFASSPSANDAFDEFADGGIARLPAHHSPSRFDQ